MPRPSSCLALLLAAVALQGTSAFQALRQPLPAPAWAPARPVAVTMAAERGEARPPVSNLKQAGKYDYGGIIAQAANAASEAIKGNGQRLITIDYPPNEGPTGVKRFETDRDFITKFLQAMGYKTVLPIGDEIIIGKNLKIGEYLSQEGLSGFTGKGFGAGVPAPSVNVVLNPSLDMSNLKDLQKTMDDGNSPLVLVNCGLERLSFLDKLGMGKYIEGFKPAYCLKRINNGFLYKSSMGAPWQTYAIFTDSKAGPYLALIDSAAPTSRPKYIDAENKIKAAVADNLEAQRQAVAEAKELNKGGKKSFGLF